MDTFINSMQWVHFASWCTTSPPGDMGENKQDKITWHYHSSIDYRKTKTGCHRYCGPWVQP